MTPQALRTFQAAGWWIAHGLILSAVTLALGAMALDVLVFP